MLRGTFADPGRLDRHDVNVDWGDGTQRDDRAGSRRSHFRSVARVRRRYAERTGEPCGYYSDTRHGF